MTQRAETKRWLTRRCRQLDRIRTPKHTHVTTAHIASAQVSKKCVNCENCCRGEGGWVVMGRRWRWWRRRRGGASGEEGGGERGGEVGSGDGGGGDGRRGGRRRIWRRWRWQNAATSQLTCAKKRDVSMCTHVGQAGQAHLRSRAAADAGQGDPPPPGLIPNPRVYQTRGRVTARALTVGQACPKVDD